MKRSVKAFTVFLAIILSVMFCINGAAAYLAPDQLTMTYPGDTLITSSFPLSLSYDNDKLAPVSADTAGNISDNTEKARLMLFGVFPVKEVDVKLQERKNVILGGQHFGIRLYTNGLVVSETSPVDTDQGLSHPSEQAGIQSGDIILSVDGKQLKTNEQLLDTVKTSEGRSISITAIRNGEKYSTSITPVKDKELQEYRTGLYVRDSCAGIGTMTYTDPQNKSFAGLGHGICDAESGSIMPLLRGDIVNADITSVRKSLCGSPGTLNGCFSDNVPLGTLRLNSEHGVYGTMNSLPRNPVTIPVAYKQEVVSGYAQLYTTIDGSSPCFYDVQIESISYNNLNTEKNMIIRVTDPELLSKTGGIVQGMSGSPIIQNDMLVGALTHVFVNEPDCGYAVFAENMISYSDEL